MKPAHHHVPLSIEIPGRAPLHDRLWMPFEPGRHAATDAILPAHREWLARHGLLDDGNARIFERARFHELAGRVYHAQDEGALRLAADFIAALFVLDDLMDTALDPACRDEARARAAIEGVRRAARTGLAPAGRRRGVSAVASAMADVSRRLSARGAPMGAYLREVEAYLDGVIEETRRRSAGFRSVADYAEVRVAFSAVYACIELGLAAQGTSLHPSARPLARLANLSVSWVNDVYSWPKERALGERSNLVAVLLDTSMVREEEAVHEACRRCDRVVQEYLRGASVDAPAQALIEGWMRGNLDWHAVGTARYTAHLSVAPVAA